MSDANENSVRANAASSSHAIPDARPSAFADSLDARRRSGDRPPVRPSRLSSTDTLGLWKDVTVASVAGDMPDLSARQMAVLMCVYLEDGPHTVRSLAARLVVTKAVISRAIDRLKSYGYILRADDPRDRRSIVLRRTPDGIRYLQDFAAIISREMPDSLRPR